MLTKDTHELWWLAGLLEGEGCFCWNRAYPVIALNMTDLDVVERTAKALGLPLTRVRGYDRPGCKRIYRVTLAGPAAEAVMRKLWPLLGDRRRSKITELLEKYEQVPRIGKGRWKRKKPCLPSETLEQTL